MTRRRAETGAAAAAGTGEELGGEDETAVIRLHLDEPSWLGGRSVTGTVTSPPGSGWLSGASVPFHSTDCRHSWMVRTYRGRVRLRRRGPRRTARRSRRTCGITSSRACPSGSGRWRKSSRRTCPAPDGRYLRVRSPAGGCRRARRVLPSAGRWLPGCTSGCPVPRNRAGPGRTRRCGRLRPQRARSPAARPARP